MDDRQEVILEIFSSKYPELAHLSAEQLVLKLQSFASRDGTLESRHQADYFIHTLICWLARNNITDQLLNELLESLPADYSDEYKPWSPEYDHPITNAEAARTSGH